MLNCSLATSTVYYNEQIFMNYTIRYKIVLHECWRHTAHTVVPRERGTPSPVGGGRRGGTTGPVQMVPPGPVRSTNPRQDLLRQDQDRRYPSLDRTCPDQTWTGGTSLRTGPGQEIAAPPPPEQTDRCKILSSRILQVRTVTISTLHVIP